MNRDQTGEILVNVIDDRGGHLLQLLDYRYAKDSFHPINVYGLVEADPSGRYARPGVIQQYVRSPGDQLHGKGV